MTTPRVSREQAELLKKVGYDVECLYRYDTYPTAPQGFIKANKAHNWNNSHASVSAPTLDEATRWLREVKGWHVYCTTCNGRWQSYVIDMRTDEIEFVNGFPTHDLALSAGIDLILKKLNDGTH